MEPAIVGTLFVALLTPLLTYLVAARKLSGRIKNSEATELWAESRSIREWSTERVKALDKHIDELEARLVEVEKKNTTVTDENRVLQKELYECRVLSNDLKSKNGNLIELLKTAEEKILRLEQKN